VLVAGLALGLPVVALLHDTSLLNNLVARLPGDVDIAHRTDGWRETAQAVEQERQHFDTNAFVIADDYGATGLYSLYSPAARAAVGSAKPLVYCFRGEKSRQPVLFLGTNTITANIAGAKTPSTLTTLRRYKLESGWIWKWLHHQPVNFRQATTPTVPKELTKQFETVTTWASVKSRCPTAASFIACRSTAAMG